MQTYVVRWCGNIPGRNGPQSRPGSSWQHLVERSVVSRECLNGWPQLRSEPIDRTWINWIEERAIEGGETGFEVRSSCGIQASRSILVTFPAIPTWPITWSGEATSCSFSYSRDRTN